MKKKSYMSWSWIFMVGFLVLSILDARFGILGIICMTTPMYHALKGKGKIHCSHYCPRGSLLGKFLKNLSLNNTSPKWMRNKIFKNILLGLMVTMLSISLIHAGGNFIKSAFSIFRFMTASLIVGIILGIVYKPRSWCQVCPMGYATGLIRDAKNNKEKVINESEKRKAA